MEWTSIVARWDEYGPQLCERWGRLTEEDIAKARGGRDELVHCVLHRYEIQKDLAERHVQGWLSSLG